MPRIDRDDHDHSQHRHRPDPPERLHSLRPTHRIVLLRRQPGPDPDRKRDRGGKQRRHHHAGQDAGQIKLADRDLVDDPEQNHCDARRDQDAERAAGGDAADAHSSVVAALEHFRNRRAADRRRSRRARAADRAEAAAGDDAGDRQRARHAVEEAVCRLEHLARQLGAGQQFGHQDEQWHRDKYEVGRVVEGERAHFGNVRRRQKDDGAHRPHQSQGERHREAETDQHQQQ